MFSEILHYHYQPSNTEFDACNFPLFLRKDALVPVRRYFKFFILIVMCKIRGVAFYREKRKNISSRVLPFILSDFTSYKREGIAKNLVLNFKEKLFLARGSLRIFQVFIQ